MEKKKPPPSSSSPSPPQAPLAMRIKESYKEYALPGFAFGSVIGFMYHQLSTNPGALVRDGVEAALCTGTTAAFQTPLFILMERSLAARRGQSDRVSFYGALLGSYFPCRVFPAYFLAARARNLWVTQLRIGADGPCGFLYWCFLWSLVLGHKERLMSPEELRSLYQDHHGFNPGFLRDFSN